MSKIVSFPDELGCCIVPVCSEDNMHEFGLYDSEGKQLHTGYFTSIEQAKLRAADEFPGNNYIIKDLDEEWYITTAKIYQKRIKKLYPSFKKSGLVLDMSNMYYNRNPNNWYTYIPFTYYGAKWCYRETANDDWIEKIVIDKSKSNMKLKLDEKLELAKDIVDKVQQSSQTDLNKNICR